MMRAFGSATTPLTRPRTIVSSAAVTSATLCTANGCSGRPRRCVAACDSRTASSSPMWSGLKRMARREMRGAASLSSSTRLPASSRVRKVMPVRLPPGRGLDSEDRRALRHEDVDLRSNQLGRNAGCLIGRHALHPAGIDREVLPLDVAAFAHPLTERIEEGGCPRAGVPGAHPAHTRHLPPLRTRQAGRTEEPGTQSQGECSPVHGTNLSPAAALTRRKYS